VKHQTETMVKLHSTFYARKPNLNSFLIKKT